METKAPASGPTPEGGATNTASPKQGKQLVNPYSPGATSLKTPFTVGDKETSGSGGGTTKHMELAMLRERLREYEARESKKSAETASASKTGDTVTKKEMAEMIGAAIVAAKGDECKTEDTRHYLSTFSYIYNSEKKRKKTFGDRRARGGGDGGAHRATRFS